MECIAASLVPYGVAGHRANSTCVELAGFIPVALPREVARFLAVEPTEIKRLAKLAGLAATRIPARMRSVLRIYLPDLHLWLLSRSLNVAALADYTAFLAI